MYTHLLLFCVQRDARLLQNVDIGGNRGVVVQIMKESRMVGTNWGQSREVILSKMSFLCPGWHGTGARGPPPKSLDSDENFKPKHTLFCGGLRFVAIYSLFGGLWAKKVPFLGQKHYFLGKKCTITWYILHILLS